MVNVPSPSVPSVAPTGTTGVPYQTGAGATPEAFGAAVGTAEQGLARQVESSSDVLEKHAMRMQEDVNASAAKDLFLQGDVAIGKLTVDYNSLEGANRVNAYPKYVEDIGKVRQDMKAAAPNADVARRFDQDFARRVGYSIVDGARSAATANKQYQKETNTAIQANAMSHIAANSQDDNRFKTEMEIGLETVRSSDDYKGASPEVRQQHEQAFTSSAWATRLQAMSKTDPLRARDLFNKNKDSGAIEGTTQLKLKDVIDQSIIQVQSRVDADTIAQSGSPNLIASIKKFEGYRDTVYDDGRQKSIGYGTKAQPGDENIPKDQREKVFSARLESEVARAAAIVDNFAPGLPAGTRDALISLTYNAGSSWTSQGLGQKVRAGDTEGIRETILQYNTSDGKYVKGLDNRRHLEATWVGRGEARDTDPISQMGAALDKAKERAIQLFPDDPANQAKYLDTVQNRIKSDFNVLKSAAHDMQLQTRNIVQRELFDPERTVTSYDKLSPAAQAAYDQAPPALQQSFQQAMRRNSTADVPLTAERQSRFDTLRGESITEPDKFMSRDISNEDIPRPQKSILLKAQADRKALVEKGGKVDAAMAPLKGELNDAQIYESRTDSAKNDEYIKFRGEFSKYLDKFYQDNKRPPNEKESRDMGKELLRNIVTSPGRFFGSNSGPAYRVIFDKTPVQVKSADDARALPSGTTFVLDGETRVRK